MSNTHNTMSETDALEIAKKLVEQYKGLEGGLRKEYKELIKIKEGFPARYLDKSEFEDLVLKASAAKFRAAQVARKLSGLASEAEYELDFLVANFKLYISDDALSEKFDKITEGLRDAYVNSKIELKELGKLVSRVKIFADSAEKMIRQFDSDEINFRRLLDRQKMMGFN